MTVGEKIRSARKAKRLTQQDVAEKLDVSRQAVAKWESDLTLPNSANLIALGELLEVSFLPLDMTAEKTPDPSPGPSVTMGRKVFSIVMACIAALAALFAVWNFFTHWQTERKWTAALTELNGMTTYHLLYTCTLQVSGLEPMVSAADIQQSGDICLSVQTVIAPSSVSAPVETLRNDSTLYRIFSNGSVSCEQLPELSAAPLFWQTVSPNNAAARYSSGQLVLEYPSSYLSAQNQTQQTAKKQVLLAQGDTSLLDNFLSRQTDSLSQTYQMDANQAIFRMEEVETGILTTAQGSDLPYRLVQSYPLLDEPESAIENRLEQQIAELSLP